MIAVSTGAEFQLSTSGRGFGGSATFAADTFCSTSTSRVGWAAARIISTGALGLEPATTGRTASVGAVAGVEKDTFADTVEAEPLETTADTA